MFVEGLIQKNCSCYFSLFLHFNLIAVVMSTCGNQQLFLWQQVVHFIRT